MKNVSNALAITHSDAWRENYHRFPRTWLIYNHTHDIYLFMGFMNHFIWNNSPTTPTPSPPVPGNAFNSLPDFPINIHTYTNHVNPNMICKSIAAIKPM